MARKNVIHYRNPPTAGDAWLAALGRYIEARASSKMTDDELGIKATTFANQVSMAYASRFPQAEPPKDTSKKP